VITAIILSVALFGVLRIPQVEQYVLIPFTKAQYSVACRIGGDSAAPISVGLSCSAADVIALSLGFILAFPVPWRKRLIGAALALFFIAAINTVRIATLTHASSSLRWFDLLHVYIWPGVLLLVVSVFVFLWMSWSLRVEPRKRVALPREGVRFVVLAVVFVALFVGSSGWWMHSEAILEVARWVAATGAFIINLFGGKAEASGNFLRTTNGGFLVTQECVVTPLIPAYLAAVLAVPMARRARLLALVGALPLFFLLGAARLLVLAFPARMVGSHLVAIHGFYQILLAAVLVALVAHYSTPRAKTAKGVARRIAVALFVGSLVSLISGLIYNRLLLHGVARFHDLIGHVGHDYLDPQGAILMLAPYQIGLGVALWIAWTRPVSASRTWIGALILVASQPVVLILIGEWVAHTGLEPHVAAMRAWTVLVVLLTAGWIAASSRSASAEQTQLRPVEAPHG
jgi:exosortase/archaeosortase family protein